MKRFTVFTALILSVMLLSVPARMQSALIDNPAGANGQSRFQILGSATRPVNLTDTAVLVSTTVVISEFRTRGPNGANDEFVEICNISASPIDISGYRINGSNSAGAISTRATVPANTMLAAGARYLFTNVAASGYSGTVPGNMTYVTGITDDGGILLLSSSGAFIDQVGMSAGSAYKEGAVLAPTTTNVNQSYERKSGGTTANLQDTDNNSADFQLNSGNSNPQNNSLSANPASLNFGNVTLGTSRTLSVTITNASNSVVTISPYSFYGADITEFSVGSLENTIPANSSLTIPVIFTPQSIADKSAVLNVKTNGNSIAVPLDGAGTGALPDLSINDVSLDEGNGGTTVYTFTVSLSSAAQPGGVTFDIATADNTATVADSDYAANSLTGQTIPQGASTYSFSVSVNGDTTVEPTETFFVNVTNVTGASVTDGQGQGTLVNDDVEPATVEFSSADYSEDESQTAVLTVQRFGNLSGTTSVNYSTEGENPLGAQATGGSACTSGVDFIHASGTLLFAAEENSKEIQIQLCGDLVSETDEFFSVYLSNPTGGVLGDIASAQVAIKDAASQYRNTAPIFVGTGGDAYDSSIEVSGAPTSIGSLRVTLFDFEHITADDVDVLLVGPEGDKILLMADAGGDDGLAESATITFDDNAGQVLPDAAQIFTGKYEPTTWEAGQTNFPAPVPAGPYGEPGSTIGGAVTLSSVFAGSNANGTWTLYIRDDNGALRAVGADGVVGGGWGIQFLAPTAAGVSVSGQVRTRQLSIPGASVTISGGDLTAPRTVKTNGFGYYSFEGLTAGQIYIVSVASKRYTFAQPSIVLNVGENVTGADFEAEDR